MTKWEHPCQSAISIKLQSKFIEIALWHGCSNDLPTTPRLFPKNGPLLVQPFRTLKKIMHT